MQMNNRQKREIKYDKNGNVYLTYYDKKYKMWVEIYCNPHNNTGTEYIKNALKDIYLSKYNIKENS